MTSSCVTSAGSGSSELVDPFDRSDHRLWVKIEHLGRYMFASRVADAEGAGTVIDAGFGAGYGIEELARTIPRVIGVDSIRRPTDPTVDECELHYYDLCGPPLSRLVGVADVVCCFEVLEHVVDAEAALGGLAAMLRPHGLLILSVPDPQAEIVDAAGLPMNRHHRRLFTFPELAHALARAGFDVEYRLGQASLSRFIARERRLRRDGVIGSHEPLASAVHDPEVVRHLAAVVGMPTPFDISGGYSITVVARLVPEGDANR